MRFVVQNKSISLLLLALLFSLSSVCHAAVQKCTAQKSAYDRAAREYARAESQFVRLQQQIDNREWQASYRRAVLEGNVDQADANLQAAQGAAAGQGLGCILSPRPGCVGPTVNSVMNRISRARALVRTQQGRLDAFNRAYEQQRSRLNQRLAQQAVILRMRKSTLDEKEAAYNACMMGV